MSLPPFTADRSAFRSLSAHRYRERRPRGAPMVAYAGARPPRACGPGSGSFAPCPAGTECTRDVHEGPLSSHSWTAAWGYCCKPGEIACREACRTPCPPPQRLEPSACECICPASTGIPEVDSALLCPPAATFDPATCECECPPTPCIGGTVDRATCQCRCPSRPSPQILCDGLCVDPLTDPWHCGGCDEPPCDVFTEKCCKGRCTRLCTDSDCRDCGDRVEPLKCCHCKPTPLCTNDNCSDCGDACTGGKVCITDWQASPPTCSCACPAGTTECGSGCCPDTRTCCNGVCCKSTEKGCCEDAKGVRRCTNLQTNREHCGECDRDCSLVNAQCVDGDCECVSPYTRCNSPSGKNFGCCSPGFYCITTDVPPDEAICCTAKGGRYCPATEDCCKATDHCCPTSPVGCCPPNKMCTAQGCA